MIAALRGANYHRIGENRRSLSDPRPLTDLALVERYDRDKFAWMESERMANISGDLVAKIDERRREARSGRSAIAEMRRLQQGREAVAIAPKSAGRILLPYASLTGGSILGADLMFEQSFEATMLILRTFRPDPRSAHERPLSRVKRTSRFNLCHVCFDPKRTSGLTSVRGRLCAVSIRAWS